MTLVLCQVLLRCDLAETMIMERISAAHRKRGRSRSVLVQLVFYMFTAISPPTLESLQEPGRRLRFEGAVTHLPPGLCLKRHMQPSQVPSPLDFLRKFLILFLQPFCQGVSTRLPFIYYVIHLDAHFGKQITDTFGSKWFPIGCFVAAFQVSRGACWTQSSIDTFLSLSHLLRVLVP